MAMALMQSCSLESLTRRTMHTAVLTPKGSKAYFKKMIPITLSFILHQRVELDKTNFYTYAYQGLEYNILKPNSPNKSLRDIKQWMCGAMDALENDYLRELYLVFESTANPGKVLESYKFQFKYTGKHAISMDPIPNRELEEASGYILTAIQSLSEHNPFKEKDVSIKMLLTYYDDVTPRNYEPPDFEYNNGEAVFRSVGLQPKDYLHLGELKTGFHTLKCRGRGEMFHLNRSFSSASAFDNTLVPIQTPVRNRSQENVPKVILMDCAQLAITEHNEIVTNKPQENGVEVITMENDESVITEEVNTINGHEELSVTSSTIEIEDHMAAHDISFKCFCNLDDKVKLIDSILCSKCSKLQHCACVGYLEGTNAPNEYVCPQCKPNNKLCPQKGKETTFSIMRLVVAVAYFTDSAPIELLNKFPDADIAQHCFHQLLHNKVILQQKGRYSVNMKLIKRKFLEVLFGQKITKVVPDSMTLGDEESQANSMVLGGEPCGKKLKRH